MSSLQQFGQIKVLFWREFNNFFLCLFFSLCSWTSRPPEDFRFSQFTRGCYKNNGFLLTSEVNTRTWCGLQSIQRCPAQCPHQTVVSRWVPCDTHRTVQSCSQLFSAGIKVLFVFKSSSEHKLAPQCHLVNFISFSCTTWQTGMITFKQNWKAAYIRSHLACSFHSLKVPGLLAPITW